MFDVSYYRRLRNMSSMSTYKIRGGNVLKGSIETTAGKNAPIAILCATLLIKGTTVLKNMTQVEEVHRMLELLESIGVTYEWKNNSTLLVDTSKKLDLNKIDRAACERMRISLLLFGALAARVKKFNVYRSGGCKLGERSVRPHVMALEELGIDFESHEGYFKVNASKLKAAEFVMYESGDTATENAIMAAVLAKGTTTIRFASANYMVQDLCYFLQKAGAKIKGVGTTTLVITGIKSLKSVTGYYLSPDPVDAMAWISLAIATKSSLVIKNCPLDFLELELLKLKVMGQEYKLVNKRFSQNKKLRVADIKIIPSSLHALPDKLYGRPFPGLNIDNVPLFLPILIMAKGQSMIHDWCYENRAIYYAEMKKLGANVLLLDPHRLLVEGPTKLSPATMNCPPAIRPGMAILIAMLAAKGESTLKDCYPIDRAYESLIKRLNAIGADIERV